MVVSVINRRDRNGVVVGCGTTGGATGAADGAADDDEDDEDDDEVEVEEVDRVVVGLKWTTLGGPSPATSEE